MGGVLDPALVTIGWTEGWAAVAPALGADQAVGRVERVDRGWCRVRWAGGSVHLRAPLDSPAASAAVGDWVVLGGAGPHLGDGEAEPDGVVLRLVLERATTLSRRSAGTRSGEQVLAANVDVVLVVHGLHVDLDLSLVERELVVAQDGGAEAVVVLTRADAFDPAQVDGFVDGLAQALPFNPVVALSSRTGEGLGSLRELVGGGTFVLLGPSGAGKSTLVNALLGHERQRTGAVRAGDGQGRHTTSANHLVPVPDVGVCIDMPGIREVGLHVAEEGLAQVFADVEEASLRCRFPDCAHDGVPGCVVVAEVDPARVARWRTLRREIDDVDDAVVEAERSRRGRPPHR